MCQSVRLNRFVEFTQVALGPFVYDLSFKAMLVCICLDVRGIGHKDTTRHHPVFHGLQDNLVKDLLEDV